ncbi:alpha-amylase family glycosyl hydrolase [Hoyosella subflava]|uniref:alpha-amylase family glycosyl hydrolase n=1 Tax=Hoyosella subflava TaxID=639313 RepID=UPI0011D17EC5|nr:alpha-amylase family glycosyl hydrolase [Hoyosella subflava]
MTVRSRHPGSPDRGRPIRPAGRPPTSVYRVQLPHAGQTWLPSGDIPELLDYLADIGISHLWLTAPDGSSANADSGVVPADYSAANLRELASVAHEREIGLIIDIVPAHTDVALPQHNAWWWDVLESGRHSRFADYFTIDFDVDPQHRLRIPVLDLNHPTATLAISGNRLRFDRPGPEFPLAPGTELCEPAECSRQQKYRLIGSDEPANYRFVRGAPRFAALRQDRQHVFDETHRFLKDLVHDGTVDGVRVLGVDDLSDPKLYLCWLRAAIGENHLLCTDTAPHRHHVLDQALPIDGTSGAEVRRVLTGVLAKPGTSDSGAAAYVPRSEFHLHMADIARHWPCSLSAAPESGPGPVPQAQRPAKLAQTLLYIMGPGLPVLDAGSEFWQPRAALSRHIRRCRELCSTLETTETIDTGNDGDIPGIAKLHVVRSALRLRDERPDVFVGGEYEPITPSGSAQSYVVAFERAREHSLPETVVVVARLTHLMPNDDGQPAWGDTSVPLPEGTWRDLLTGKNHSGEALAADMFSELPVALLVRGGGALREPRRLVPRADTPQPEADPRG